MIIEAGLTRYEAVNEEIEKQLKKQNKVTVKDVNGQRYIGCALDEGKTVEVYGTPGNDMACYLNGGRVVVYGNCQDAVGNTMGGGEIVVHGHSGDAMGYGMRDGQIYIRDNVACRGGIHMKEFLLPYGKEKLTAAIEEEHLAGVLLSELHSYKAPKSGSELVQDALEHPIGTPRLCDMAIGKKNIVVISSDHTRPVPSHIMMPLILAEIRKGNPDADITILISTGLHRTTTQEELTDKFGPEIMANEKIIVHDCDDNDNLVYLGKLPSGGNLIINRLAAEADLLVAEGFIEPHFFAGFSGGRKSVLPGVASRETVMYNHNSGFIADPHARTGVIEGNPIHNDMLYAARAARLDFIVNVVIDAAHDPIFAVAGDCDLAHRVGREFLASKCQVDAVPADIVISTNGGYPLDQNIYQSVKGMTAGEATVKEGGVIIMLSKAADGHGGKYFHETFRDEKDLNRMMQTFLDRKPEETIIDQWQSQIFARLLLKATVIFISSCDDQLVEDLHMVPAHSMEEAMEKAKAIVGKEDYKVTVIPDGVSVIVKE